MLQKNNTQIKKYLRFFNCEVLLSFAKFTRYRNGKLANRKYLPSRTFVMNNNINTRCAFWEFVTNTDCIITNKNNFFVSYKETNYFYFTKLSNSFSA